MEQVKNVCDGTPDNGDHQLAATAGVDASRVSTIEAELRTVWMQLLGVPDIERNQTFLMLGGESLLAVQVAARIQERYGVEVPLRAIFVGSVESLARDVSALLGESPSRP